jgi:DNA polymerase
VTVEPSLWSAAPFVPAGRRLPALEDAARQCTGCPLYRDATQTVFGRGPKTVSMMLVGEQPGDREDLEGEPFVGPAGKVLWQCLDAAGIGRDEVYVTNAVKHFKHELRGKRRLHKRPNVHEIERCKWWLDLELAIVRPKVVVALGATAARSLFGRPVPIEKSRGAEMALEDGMPAFVTQHPSAILRIEDEAEKRQQYRRLVADLRRAARSAR